MPRGDEAAFLWVVYVKRGGAWSHQIVPGGQRSIALTEAADGVVVTAVDRCRNESDGVVALVSSEPYFLSSFSPPDVVGATLPICM